MCGEAEKFAFEIGLIIPNVAGSSLFRYTILMLNPTRALFHGHGAEIGEVRDTAKAHVAFLTARGVVGKNVANINKLGRMV